MLRDRRAGGPDRRGAPAQRQRGLPRARAAVLRGRRRHGRRAGRRGRVGDRRRARSRARPTPARRPRSSSRASLREANRRIFDLAARTTRTAGMGTTLTAAWSTATRSAVVHVGDSRAYRLRDGELEQLTRDHSLVEELAQRAGSRRRRPRSTRSARSSRARSAPSRDVRGRRLHAPGARRRPLPDLLRRPHEHGPDEELARDPARRGDRSTRPPSRWCARPTRAAARQHHGGAVPPRRGRRRRAGCGGPARGRDDRRRRRRRAEVAGGAPTDAAAAGRDRSRRRRPRSRRRPTRRRRRSAAAARPPAQAAPATTLRRCVAAVAGRSSSARGARTASASQPQVYFVGTNDRGLVTLYRGVPYELPLGIDLYDGAST